MINKYNPYPSFQAGQAEAITQMLDLIDSGKKVIELNAPTAAGKSLDLFVLGRVLSMEYGMDKVIYTTPLVALVNQLGSNELFNKKMPVLKGKRNYPCLMGDENMPMWADDCPFDTFGDALSACAQANRDKVALQGKRLAVDDERPCIDCPYQKDRVKFVVSPFGATTFDRYILDPSCWKNCEALFVDESAGLEKKLLNHSTLKLPEQVDTKRLQQSVAAYVDDLERQVESLNVDYANAKQRANGNLFAPKVVRIRREIRSTEAEMYKCNKVLYHIEHEHPYIIDRERQFRLLLGKSEFERMSKDLKVVVLASGTPTTRLLTDDYESVKIQHPIAVDRRLVYYTPVGSMNWQSRNKTIPAMADEIERLHAKYHKKTMVHCSVYAIAAAIYEKMSLAARKITILQADKTKREHYKNYFLDATGERIFLSIDFCEGLDLKGPDYPMNIIVKLPFENFKDDEFVAARNEMDGWMRYNTNTAVNVMQASGRCTRSPNDFSETYILDESWRYFVRRNRKLLEPWFLAALR